MKNINLQIQESQPVPNRMTTKRSTPRDIIDLKTKDKENILRGVIEKQIIMYKEYLYG